MPGLLGSARTDPALRGRRGTRRIVGFLLMSLGVGAISGLLWARVVTLPGYRVGPDGGASTTERGLAGFIGGDAWFSALGLLLGALLGLLGWRLFRRSGWFVPPLVVLVALGSAVTCWVVGHQLGPGPFEPRLAAAQPGDLVPIDLTLRAKVSLLVWPFAAVIPVLLGSSLGRDEEEPAALFPRGARD